MRPRDRDERGFGYQPANEIDHEAATEKGDQQTHVYGGTFVEFAHDLKQHAR